jgi:hypothetical protein
MPRVRRTVCMLPIRLDPCSRIAGITRITGVFRPMARWNAACDSVVLTRRQNG